MKKRFWLNLILIFILVLSFSLNINVYETKAQSFASYVSGITIQNLETSQATVTVDYYNQSGTVAHQTTDTIPAFGVKDYATIPTSSGFQGSVVISSTNKIAAVSTLRGDNRGRGAYIGMSEGATTAVLPVLMKNWGSSSWNTWFAVQNIGTGDATITVNYAACPGNSDKEVTGVKPKSMVTFSQSTETCFTSSKVLTSAVVTSNQPIIIVVSQESTIVNSSLVSQGFTAGDTNPVIPLMNSNNPDTSGWRTAISVFNMGTQDTTITMTYVRANDGSTCTETQTIPSQQSKIFAGNSLIVGAPAGVTLTCPVGQRLVGSAYVSNNTNSQPLAVTVNQDRGTLSSAYAGFSPSSATPKVVFPQIQDRNGAASQWASSFMIFNVGSSPTYVKCTFTNTSYTAQSGALAPLKAWEDLQRGKIASSYVGSGECTAYTNSSYTTIDTSARIVGVVNIRGTGTGLFDLMMSYEGINVTP
ncbi:MAG: hypothetical protein KatS3mg083_635 [Candidatus Dojkabacteria bacterium]|nr:MAG: hypothetical protein KatS3mg045_1595 [Bellilinea sp.]GIW57690.1 MAG: hypothetical protein KatS3mg083_635 [Candidatus Dojkabacteria bacterium]